MPSLINFILDTPPEAWESYWEKDLREIHDKMTIINMLGLERDAIFEVIDKILDVAKVYAAVAKSIIDAKDTSDYYRIIAEGLERLRPVKDDLHSLGFVTQIDPKRWAWAVSGEKRSLKGSKCKQQEASHWEKGGQDDGMNVPRNTGSPDIRGHGFKDKGYSQRRGDDKVHEKQKLGKEYHKAGSHNRDSGPIHKDKKAIPHRKYSDKELRLTLEAEKGKKGVNHEKQRLVKQGDDPADRDLNLGDNHISKNTNKQNEGSVQRDTVENGIKLHNKLQKARKRVIALVGKPEPGKLESSDGQHDIKILHGHKMANQNRHSGLTDFGEMVHDALEGERQARRKARQDEIAGGGAR